MRERLSLQLVAAGLVLVLVETPALAAIPQDEDWFRQGEEALADAKRLSPAGTRAKNVILFVGDGMGVSTVTAARILAGQLKGKSGEDNLMSFEMFPYLALSKTYSVNQQTPDSAPTMTAMVTGVKTKDGILSIDKNVVRGDYTTVAGNRLTTILERAEDRGLSTGVVTTARVTHATPGACYAHSPERDWEADSEMPSDAVAGGFPDIARQLIEFKRGNGIEVALGGGRRSFLPETAADPEDSGKTGIRLDGRYLAQEWLSKLPNSQYVWNRSQFRSVDTTTTDHLLGLFERSHMEYENERTADTGGEPSLHEMTATAIKILGRNPKGFFLHVEAGRIDHGHHASNAYRALTDTIELARAVQTALDMTDPNETLIIVTADHSHVFTIAGYPTRGNPILGKVIGNDDRGNPDTEYALDGLGLAYTTLTYANGPGYTGASSEQGEGTKLYPHYGQGYTGIENGRPDIGAMDTADASYLQEAAVPLGSETHAGEDVAIYATGPGAQLFHGVQEQNYIYHVMAEALGIANND